MSERLPALRARDVVRALERGHCRLIHTSDAARRVTIPLYGSSDLKRGTLRGIIAQAGLTVAEFLALL